MSPCECVASVVSDDKVMPDLIAGLAFDSSNSVHPSRPASGVRRRRSSVVESQ